MHIFFGTRGIKHLSDEFIKQLSCQYLPYEYEKGKEMGRLQVRVSPIRLYDVSFPAPFKDAMLTTLFGKGGGKAINKKHNKWAALIRKILGIKKIPKYDTSKQLNPVPNSTEMIGIGIKEDKFIDGIEQI